MIEPILIDCQIGTWTKVMSSVTTGRIDIKDTIAAYWYTFREAGSPEPKFKDEAIRILTDGADFRASKPSDVYIYCERRRGVVRVNGVNPFSFPGTLFNFDASKEINIISFLRESQYMPLWENSSDSGGDLIQVNGAFQTIYTDGFGTRGAVDFEGTTRFMTFESEVNALDITIMIVVDLVDIEPEAVFFSGSGGATQNAFGVLGPGNNTPYAIINGESIFPVALNSISGKAVYYFRRNTDISQVTFGVNGDQESIRLIGTGVGSNISIINLSDQLVSPINGKVAELHAWDKALTDESIDELVSHYRLKWGI